MTVGTWRDINANVDSASQYKAGIDGNSTILKRLGNAFAAHEQTVPTMSVRIEAGFTLTGGVLTEVAAQTIAGFTAPSALPRIDRIVLDPTTGTCSRIAGAEAGSPVAPIFGKGLLPVCQILFQTSTLVIANSMITDERARIVDVDISGMIDLGNTSGTDTYTITNAASPLQSWVTGKIYRAKFGATNTSTAPTLNPDSAGARTIKKPGSVILSPGDIQSGMAGLLYNDGSNLILLNPAKGTLRGIQTVWIPAAAFTPRTTNGPAATTLELATNKVMRKTIDFDPSTNQFAQFVLKMPKGWDEGTVTAKFLWTFASGSGNVVWGIQAVAESDGDNIDAAFGTGIEVTDSTLSANQVHLSPGTAAVTAAGSPQPEDMVVFQVYRNAASGSDTLATSSLLLGVELAVNFDAADDS